MGHLRVVIACIYCHHMLPHLRNHLHIVLSCSGLNSHRPFSPDICHPSCSKLENDPDDTTQMIQSMSPSRRRFTPNFHLKPPIHSDPLHHRRMRRASNLWRHFQSPTTPTSQQHVHHCNGLQPKQRRSQFNRNQ
jgi:hypothetical protein